MIQCKSAGKCVACTLLPYLRVRILSPMREFSADMTAPQSAMLCMDFSAKRTAPEPSERRATKGFCKRTIFTRKTSGRLSSSEDRLILCYSFLRNKSLSPSFGKDVR